MSVVRRGPPLGGEAVAQLEVASGLKSREHDGVGVAHVGWHAKLHRIEAVAAWDAVLGRAAVAVANAEQKCRREIVSEVDSTVYERVGDGHSTLCHLQI